MSLYTDINPVPLDTAYGVGGYHFFRGVPAEPIHVKGDVYVVGYSGRDDFGIGITAFRIDGITGQITTIATVEYVPAIVEDNCHCWQLLHIAGDVFACVWENDPADTMNISTFSCDEDGNLSPAWIGTLAVSVSCGDERGASACRVEGSTNMFAVAWIEDLGLYYGRIQTVEINASGQIMGAIDTWTYDLGVLHNNIWNIGGTVYCVSHTRAVGLQTVYTFNINPNGTLPAVDAPPISPSLIDWHYINAQGGTNQRTKVTKLTTTMYALPLCTLIGPFPPDNEQALYTITIDAAGYFGQILDFWDPFAPEPIYEGRQARLGPSENNRGHMMLILCDGWGPPDNNFVLYEILNNGQLVKDRILEQQVWENDWCRLPQMLNISEWTVTPMVLVAFEGTNLAWDYGVALQTYQIMPVVTYTAPVVQTLPATNISRS